MKSNIVLFKMDIVFEVDRGQTGTYIAFKDFPSTLKTKGKMDRHFVDILFCYS